MTVTDDGHVAISYGDLRSPYGKVTVVRKCCSCSVKGGLRASSPFGGVYTSQ